MKIAFTMPGRHGDILWSLPTVRALAETYDQPVTLVLSPKYASLADLLRLQPYIAEVAIDPAWAVQETAPMSPRIPPTPIEADLVVHGGYEGWPPLPLPLTIEATVRVQLPPREAALMPRADLSRPWITVTRLREKPARIAIGFSDEWFELKFGVQELVAAKFADDARFLCGPGSRWANEVVSSYCDEGTAITDVGCVPIGWLEAARIIDRAEVFLGCCSALHVLAVAVGTPCVVMEPNPQRHHSVFWPLGMDGPQVTCVKGGDGQPTFDSRHVAETLTAVLSRPKVAP